MTNLIPENKILIQFDGMCVLCSRTIRFILKADKHSKFIFQAFQSATANENYETVKVIEKDNTFRYFDAVVKIGNELGGIYRIFNIFRILPRKWRTIIYMWIAQNRFKWFGKRTSCYLPTEDEKERFI